MCSRYMLFVLILSVLNFSQAVQVDKTLYVSGQIGIVPEVRNCVRILCTCTHVPYAGSVHTFLCIYNRSLINAHHCGSVLQTIFLMVLRNM